MVGDWFNKRGTCTYKAGLGWLPDKEISASAWTESERLYGGLSWSSHVYGQDGLNNTLLSQACVLQNGSDCGNSVQNVHSKDKRWGEELPVAQTQLGGQLAVTSSQ